MPRPLRIEFDGALYLIRSLGNRSEAIFKDSEDRERFLLTLGEACAKTGWSVHAYCLLDNEFDLVIETPQPNLVFGMKWFLGSYTMRHNRRHGVSGHLFAGRYRSWVVDAATPGYLAQACARVHLRPARTGAANPASLLTDFPWSSAHSYALPPDQCPGWLQTARLLTDLGIPNDAPAGQRQFAVRLEEQRVQSGATDADWTGRGWCLGSEEFRREMVGRIPRSHGQWPDGAPRKEAAALQAESLVQEELRRLGWAEPDLRRTAKGAAEKVEIARRLRRETAVSFKWIAQRLQMGSWTYVANLVYAPASQAPKPTRAPVRLRKVLRPVLPPTAPAAPAEPPPGNGTDEPLPVYCL